MECALAGRDRRSVGGAVIVVAVVVTAGQRGPLGVVVPGHAQTAQSRGRTAVVGAAGEAGAAAVVVGIGAGAYEDGDSAAAAEYALVAPVVGQTKHHCSRQMLTIRWRGHLHRAE